MEQEEEKRRNACELCTFCRVFLEEEKILYLRLFRACEISTDKPGKNIDSNYFGTTDVSILIYINQCLTSSEKFLLIFYWHTFFIFSLLLLLFQHLYPNWCCFLLLLPLLLLFKHRPNIEFILLADIEATVLLV